MANQRSGHGHMVIFIVNNIAPYGYELNSILGLRIGSYRFRYHQMWFAMKNPFDIAKQEGLVVMRELETATFYPLRRITVGRVTRVGDIYHVEYTLGNLIDLASDKAARRSQINRFTGLLNKELDVPNNPNEYLDKSVLLAADHAHFIYDEDFKGEKSDQELNSWGTIADVLGGMKFYEDFDFFRVVKLFDEQGNEAPLRKGGRGDLSFSLKPKTTYQLDVFQKASLDSPLRSAVQRKRDLVLSGLPDEVLPIRSVQHIVGKYDQLTFTFKTSSITQRKDSYILLDVKYNNNSDPQIPHTPPIQIPVQFLPLKYKKALFIITFILFVLNVYILFFTDQFLAVFTHQITQNKIDIAQRLAILFMVITGTTAGDTAKSLLSLMDLSISPFSRIK